MHKVIALTHQMDLRFWGAWFYNADFPADYTEGDVLDQESAHYMGGEL